MKKASVFCLLFTLLVTLVGRGAETPLVTVCHVRHGVAFEDAVRVQGTVRTKDSARVAARVPGTIDELCAAEGDRVKKGDPLFRIDRANLENAVRAAEDDRAMAKARFAQAEVQRLKADTDHERLQRLLAAQAVTRDLAEKADVAAKSAAAALDAARAAVTKAETALAVARKNLADSEGRAPFDGVLTRKFKDTGDYAAPGVPIFELENTAVCEIRFSLNASDYPKVRVGETEVVLRTVDGGTSARKITYRSPTVNPVMRTFEIRVPVETGTALAPGMLVDATVVFSRTVADALPASAVNLIGGRETVYVVRNGRIEALAVEAGAEQNGLRAVRGVPDGAEVVESAMLLLNPGEEVRTAPCS